MNSSQLPNWDEQDSQTFIDYGYYFVPERERQIQTIVDLIPQLDQPHTIMELCCGEGLLAEAILTHHPHCTLHCLDGSTEMLNQTAQRLAQFSGRFDTKLFDLLKSDWRVGSPPLHGVVSSLAIHHLDGDEKQQLFRDIHGWLASGGVFIIADLMEPAHPLGWEVAAKAWDETVQERAMALDGTLDGFTLFNKEEWNMYRHFDPDDIDKPSRLFDQLKWLEAAGFVEVDVFWMKAGHAIFGGRKA
ncbi:MAG: class I SAM-dependent methyltransferase [Chloroflexota bacterium]